MSASLDHTAGKSLKRRGLSALALALVVTALAACTDPTSPLTPSALAVVSGDQQSVLVGSSLVSPLVVEVFDQNGAPLAGVTVDWTINSGGGALSVSSSISDANGKAEASYTAGLTPGSASIAATVSGLNAATFTVTVNDFLSGVKLPL
jgi:hypothetical protein